MQLVGRWEGALLELLPDLLPTFDEVLLPLRPGQFAQIRHQAAHRLMQSLGGSGAILVQKGLLTLLSPIPQALYVAIFARPQSIAAKQFEFHIQVPHLPHLLKQATKGMKLPFLIQVRVMVRQQGKQSIYFLHCYAHPMENQGCVRLCR